MLEKIAALYRKAEMGLIGGLSGTTSIVVEETCFYDVGYLRTQIERIKKELSCISDELNLQFEQKDRSDYARRHQNELLERREQLLLRMVFLASNSFGNLNDCIRLADGHHWDFISCIQGLQEYQAGRKEQAFQRLEAYSRQHGGMGKHFLANKVFGLLLAENLRDREAIPVLTRALQLVPDDMECLEKLERCCRRENDGGRASAAAEILALLGRREGAE